MLSSLAIFQQHFQPHFGAMQSTCMLQNVCHYLPLQEGQKDLSRKAISPNILCQEILGAAVNHT